MLVVGWLLENLYNWIPVPVFQRIKSIILLLEEVKLIWKLLQFQKLDIVGFQNYDGAVYTFNKCCDKTTVTSTC